MKIFASLTVRLRCTHLFPAHPQWEAPPVASQLPVPQISITTGFTLNEARPGCLPQSSIVSISLCSQNGISYLHTEDIREAVALKMLTKRDMLKKLPIFHHQLVTCPAGVKWQ